MLPSHKNFLGGDELDHDGIPPIIAPDPADIADADAFEELAQNNQSAATTPPDQSALNESPDFPDASEDVLDNAEACNAEAVPTVVTDPFPSASAGAPIDGMSRGSTIYESQQGADGDSIWYPFQSQCDWLLARWAKMRGPTSSAVTELLAIPEV